MAKQKTKHIPLFGLTLCALGALSLAGCTVHVHHGTMRRTSARVVMNAPRMVFISGTRIQHGPDHSDNIFFYQNAWYLYRGGVWHSGHQHGGPWQVVADHRVPAAFKKIPPGVFKRRGGPNHPGKHLGQTKNLSKKKFVDKKIHEGRGPDKGRAGKVLDKIRNKQDPDMKLGRPPKPDKSGSKDLNPGHKLGKPFKKPKKLSDSKKLDKDDKKDKKGKKDKKKRKKSKSKAKGK